jgi:hypothetical protein
MEEKNEFDTNYTILYKNAYLLNQPAKYIILQSDGTYVTVFDVVKYRLSLPDATLYKVWNSFEKTINAFSLIEFCYIYYGSVILDKGDKTEALKNINGLIEDVNANVATDVYENNQEVKRFESLTELNESFSFWRKKYIQERDKDISIALNILNVQNKLKETEPTPITNLQITNVTLEYTTKYEDRIPNKYDGITIFDSMETNIFVPYIQWNDPNGQKYYKVYESEDMKNYEVILNQQFRKINSLYFLVMVDEPGETLTKKTYTKCAYSFETNKLRISIPVDRKEKVFDRIRKVLPVIELENEKEFSLKGKFDMHGLKLDMSSFHFLLLNDDDPYLGLNSILSTYLYIDETKTSIINRDFISLRYKTIEPPDEDEFEVEEAENEISSAAMLSLREDDIEIDVVKVKSREILDQFKLVFERLITIYMEYKEPTEELIDSAVPEEKVKQEQVEKKEKKLAALKAIAPDVFAKGQKGYARKCACNRQPIIVDDVEAVDWRNKTFPRGEDDYYRQIGIFPPPNPSGDTKISPMFKYVCPDDESPYPTVIENNESNKEKYPFVPCCALDDSISNPKSSYNLYYEGQQQKDAGGSKGYKVNTMKVLAYETRGSIPKQVQDLLSSVYKDQKFEFERYGVGRSPNSFIHCVLIANQDYEYRGLNQEGKELYCVQKRVELLEKFKDMSIFKQELFDMNDEEIRSMILDTSSFFDPSLFYRAVEEVYNVNVFVFNPGNEDHPEPFIELPRHRLMHIRPINQERMSLIIIKHMGGESEDLKYAQCELIVNSGGILNAPEMTSPKKARGRPAKADKIEKKVEFLFSETMTTMLFRSLQISLRNYLFTFKSIDKYEKEVELRFDPYMKIQWLDVFKAPFEFAYQNIDNYGKARSFTLKFGNEEKTLHITLFVPPTQPLDLPHDNKIYYSEPEVVKRIFGIPIKTTGDGYWYPAIGFEYGFFVPCKDEASPGESSNQIPIQIQFAKEMNRKPNPIENYRNTKKYAKILIDLIIWGLRSNGILNLSDFVERFDSFVKVDDSVSSDAFPTVVYRKLPDVGNFGTLTALWPEYFLKTNKIRLNKTLYEKLKVYLKRYYTDFDGLSLPPNPYLNNVYEYEWDFKAHPHTRVLIGQNHFEAWNAYYRVKKNTGSIVYTRINKDMIMNSAEPILFKDENTSKIYVIQNVKGRLKEKALFLSNHWKEYKFNFGYDPPIDEEASAKTYAVYGITYDDKLYLQYARNLKEESSKEYLQVLEFDPGFFAALLPVH